MESSKGYYSLIQYCPDLARLEAANIGVILFCPELKFIRAKVAQGNDRIRRFFGSQDDDWTQINAVKNTIVNRLEVTGKEFKSLDDLTNFIATRANEVQVTAPRPMKVSEPETDLDELFEDLVGGRSKQPLKYSALPVEKALERTFREKGVDEFIRRDVTVTVPAFHKSLTVPFGFQNGRFNLIQPVRFQQITELRILDTACRHAVEGRSLYEHPDEKLGQLKLIVVGSFVPESSEYKDLVNDILKENKVDLHSIDEVQKLVDEIRTTGKVLPASLF
jgi:Protein of unknown function (DUF3037)